MDWKGELLTSLEKYDEALNCFDRGLEINRDNVYLLFSKTRTYIFKGDYDSALKCANNNLKIHPEIEECFMWKAYVFHEMKIMKTL